jgi:hypothetical protein
MDKPWRLPTTGHNAWHLSMRGLRLVSQAWRFNALMTPMRASTVGAKRRDEYQDFDCCLLPRAREWKFVM